MLRHSHLIPLVMISVASIAIAGDLNPPPGPVAPTMKTLEQVEPRTPVQSLAGNDVAQFVIGQPGSYYLTGNIVGLASRHGILIAASDVTLDLNGFGVFGVAGSLAGITESGSDNNIVIRNGTVEGWGQSGIVFDLATSVRIEGVHAHSNLGDGIRVGSQCIIRNCTTEENLGGGVNAQGGEAIIENCTALFNGGAGLYGGEGTSVLGCVVKGNQLDGVLVGAHGSVVRCVASENGAGINSLGASLIADCVAQSNTNAGISGATGSEIRGCVSRGNLPDGIQLLGPGSVIDCTTDGNGFDGISVEFGSPSPSAGSPAPAGAGAVISRCRSFRNTGSGIFADRSSVIESCAVTDNGGDGIDAAEGCTVRANTVSHNADDGIRLGGACLATGNTCEGNGQNSVDGAGIHSYGTGNRIDGNSCSFNRVGFDSELPGGATLIRNSAYQNTVTAYILQVSDRYGLVSPSSGPITSDNPWLNFAD